MENKLNQKFIKRYSAVFAAKVNDDFFSQREVISGKEILTLTKISQINLFTIKTLFEKWQQESKNIRSPFFDYDDDKVSTALKVFMNTLSNHIQVRREHFEELLREAVEKSILLLFSPYDFYCEEIKNLGSENIEPKDLRNKLKYVKINNHLLENLIRKIESADEHVNTTRALSIFDEVCSSIQDSPEDFDSYLISLSEVVPISLAELFPENSSGKIEEKEESPPIENMSIKDEKLSNLPSGEEEIASTFEEKTEPVQLNIETVGKNLNDQFVRDKKTLNDQIKAKLDSTIADLHQKKKIETVAKSISINERFMFVNELFGGDKSAFNQAIDAIDLCASHTEASSLVLKEYVAKFNWNEEKKEVKDLLELIDRKYTSE